MNALRDFFDDDDMDDLDEAGEDPGKVGPAPPPPPVPEAACREHARALEVLADLEAAVFSLSDFEPIEPEARAAIERAAAYLAGDFLRHLHAEEESLGAALGGRPRRHLAQLEREDDALEQIARLDLPAVAEAVLSAEPPAARDIEQLRQVIGLLEPLVRDHMADEERLSSIVAAERFGQS